MRYGFFILVLFVSGFSNEYPITAIFKDSFIIKGHLFSYTENNRPEPFEVGQTFIVYCERVIPVLEDSYRVYIGLKSPITSEMKYFLSTMNSRGDKTHIQTVVETGRSKNHIPARSGPIPRDEMWGYTIWCDITLEDQTKYKTFISKYDSSQEVAKRKVEETRKQFFDHVFLDGGSIAFEDSVFHAPSPMTYYVGRVPGIAYGFELEGPYRRFSAIKRDEDNLIFLFCKAENAPFFHFLNFGPGMCFYCVEGDAGFRSGNCNKARFIRSFYNAGEREYVFEELATRTKHTFRDHP